MKRDKIVMVRLSPEERTLWQAAADASERKLADWVRFVVNAHLKTSEPLPRKKGGR